MVEFIKLGLTLLVISVVINMGLIAVNVSGTVPGGILAGSDFNSTSGVFAGLTHDIVQKEIVESKPKSESGALCSGWFQCGIQTISGTISNGISIVSQFTTPISVFVTLLGSSLTGYYNLALWLANPLEKSALGPIHLLFYLIATPLQLLVYAALLYYVKEIVVIGISIFR